MENSEELVNEVLKKQEKRFCYVYEVYVLCDGKCEECKEYRI